MTSATLPPLHTGATLWHYLLQPHRHLGRIFGVLVALAGGTSLAETTDPVASTPCAILTPAQIEAVVGRAVSGTQEDRLGEAGTALGRCTWTITPPDFPPIEGKVIVEIYGDGQQQFDEQMELFGSAYELTDQLGAVSAAYGPGGTVSFVAGDLLFTVQVLVHDLEMRLAALDVARLIQKR